MSHTEKKKIAVLTGTRAEYGLLRPVLQKLAASEELELLLLVSGAHLSSAYGATVSEIEADGMPIAARIPILLFEDDPLRTLKTVAYATEVYGEWLAEVKPHALLILGDRYEAFAAAQAAALQHIPLVHISGGDVTLGAADDWYRHCISKMAALHFPSCRDSAERLLRMGELPSRVFCVGGLGDENIRAVPRMTLQELSDNLSFDLTAPFSLVTFHPETAAGCAPPAEQMQAMLLAMEDAHRESGIRFLITKSNADAGGAELNAMIDSWSAAHSDYAAAFTSLGLRRYLSAMAGAAVVLGNSSSGVVETPSFGVPTVNIGKRQEGRIICSNVICCDAEREEIFAALQKAQSAEFKAVAAATVSPYHGENTSGDIVRITAEMLQSGILHEAKEFYDYPCKEDQA